MDSETKARIEQFISIVEKIKKSRFVKETKQVSFQFNFSAGEPLKQEISGFDEEDLRSMLIDLRKFTLAKDGVRLIDICDLLIANTSDQEIITNVEKCKNVYNSLMAEPKIKMTINGASETGLDIMKKWLYGCYFHEKQHSKDLVNLGIAQPLHKTNFVNFAIDLISLAMTVAYNASMVLKP